MAFIIRFLKGILVGAANVIPGVSGGTIAVITGLFDPLIEAVTGFFRDWKRSTIYLLPILLGAAVGLLGLARVLEPLLENYPIPTLLFFTGLVLGSLPFIAQRATERKFHWSHAVAAALALGLMIAMLFMREPATFWDPSELNIGQMLTLCAYGALAAAAMVIPGVSGSFVMLILGVYGTILAAVNAMNLSVLLPFGIGVIIGLLAIAKVLQVLLRRYPAHTFWAILGLMVGAVPGLLKEMGRMPSGWEWLIGIAALVLGCVLALTLGSDPGDTAKDVNMTKRSNPAQLRRRSHTRSKR